MSGQARLFTFDYITKPAYLLTQKNTAATRATTSMTETLMYAPKDPVVEFPDVPLVVAVGTGQVPMTWALMAPKVEPE